MSSTVPTWLPQGAALWPKKNEGKPSSSLNLSFRALTLVSLRTTSDTPASLQLSHSVSIWHRSAN
eukprot:scaffold3573_cov101-Skeletonema_marinoi.AAC.2